MALAPTQFTPRTATPPCPRETTLFSSPPLTHSVSCARRGSTRCSEAPATEQLGQPPTSSASPAPSGASAPMELWPQRLGTGAQQTLPSATSRFLRCAHQGTAVKAALPGRVPGTVRALGIEVGPCVATVCLAMWSPWDLRTAYPRRHVSGIELCCGPWWVWESLWLHCCS